MNRSDRSQALGNQTPRSDNASCSISGILPILSILSKLPVFETSGWMRAIRRQDEQDLQDGGGLGLEDPMLASELEAFRAEGQCLALDLRHPAYPVHPVQAAGVRNLGLDEGNPATG
jgi:hypothetical protein